MYATRSYHVPAGFPQVPFNGPPPQPSHIRANPQDWQNGSWSINPAFNASQWTVNSAAAWMPAQAWAQRHAAEWHLQQQQQQMAANYNPFKRVPRPPSAEYLATKLSDNPLGLTNMIPREELFGPRTDGIAAPTPWVWTPRNLDEDGDEADSQPPPPTSAPPIYTRPTQTREMTDPIPSSSRLHHPSTPVRHSSEPPERPRHSRPADNLTPSRELQLQPTFSAVNVVRTPEHYRTRSSSAGPSPSPQPLYGPPTPRRSSVDSDLSNRMERLSTNGLSRHSSLPAPLSAPLTGSTSMIGVTNMVDEPASLLSPLVGVPHNGNKHATRPLGASSSLSAIPEGMDNNTDSTRRSQQRKSKSGSRRSRHTSPVPSGSATSPPPLANMFAMTPQMQVYPSGEQQQSVTPPHNLTPPHNPGGSSLTPPHGSQLPVTPSRISPHSHSGSSLYSTPTHPSSYSHSHSHSHNPLPPPPQETPLRDPSLRIPIQKPPPERWRKRIRRGMWNRRGDHLTMDGFIVYAPPSIAYPDELADYPAETVGYRDHLGVEIMYMERPELPESLPRYGQPPLQPYEKFVVYDYQ
ncbi:hypothetical protein HMN09_00330500 [Mycena chlorophos]|uniref:Uncharacterized protein n=1 Tax=Mycena chlorophos TaxID=658473 RepID=A0A8H6TK90_MYCCL|nr:hypothetical protein HMN09_00330500 [Mycena chlorophos]